MPTWIPVPSAATASKPVVENAQAMIAVANVAVLAQQVGKSPLATANLSATPAITDLETEDTSAQAASLSLVMANPELSKRLTKLMTSDKPSTGTTQLSQANAAENGNKNIPPTTLLEDLHLELPAAWSVDDKGTLVVDSTPAQSGISPALGAASPSPQGVPFANSASKPEVSSLLAQADERNVQYQQLANRLGEALSQRLLAQIERGEWKMQMRMQPAGLGQIDVSLDMNAAGLNAMFSADSSVTRDLIAQGAGRLRDSLAEAGMAVANLWVNADASRQSGGKPTPGQAFKEAPKTQNKVTDTPVLSAVQVRSVAGPSDAARLDLLA